MTVKGEGEKRRQTPAHKQGADEDADDDPDENADEDADRKGEALGVIALLKKPVTLGVVMVLCGGLGAAGLFLHQMIREDLSRLGSTREANDKRSTGQETRAKELENSVQALSNSNAALATSNKALADTNTALSDSLKAVMASVAVTKPRTASEQSMNVPPSEQ